MKMRAIKLFAAILFVASLANAVQDRFGSERYEVPRTSFTDTQDFNVRIASITEPRIDFASMTPTSGGSLVVRSIVISGIVPSTITFYDDTQFNSASSTRARVHYYGSPISAPVEIDLDLFMSSGIIYNKVGTAPMLIKWDWLSPRKRGDARK